MTRRTCSLLGAIALLGALGAWRISASRDEPARAPEQPPVKVATDRHVTQHARVESPPRTLDDAYARQLSEVNTKLAADPIAQKVPMLYDKPREKQIETLHWMLDLPPDKLVAALPEVASDPELSADERRQVAVATVRELIDDHR